MHNGPKLWNKLLSEAPEGSVLMGGAVVDWHLGHEAKDYDIFHTYKVGEPVNLPPNWKMTEAQFNDEAWAEAHQQQYLQGIDENGGHPIGSVYEYMIDNHFIVQLIGVNYEDPKTHFKNFDHSLTLGRYTKTGLFIHKKVFDSIHNHVVEYVSKNHELESVQRSLARAKSKVKKYTADHGNNWAFKNFISKPKVELWGGGF